MDTLRIPLFGMPEEGLEVAAELPVAALRPMDGESFPGETETVTLNGWLTPVDETYLFRGAASGVFVHACDRCLAEARQEYAIDVLWAFEEGPPLRPFDDILGDASEEAEADGGCSPQRFQNGVIDLATPLWEELQLAAPEKYLCGDACKGLCPRCGANRNETECVCETGDEAEVERNNGLAGLAELFPELTKEKPKE